MSAARTLLSRSRFLVLLAGISVAGCSSTEVEEQAAAPTPPSLAKAPAKVEGTASAPEDAMTARLEALAKRISEAMALDEANKKSAASKPQFAVKPGDKTPELIVGAQKPEVLLANQPMAVEELHPPVAPDATAVAAAEAAAEAAPAPVVSRAELIARLEAEIKNDLLAPVDKTIALTLLGGLRGQEQAEAGKAAPVDGLSVDQAVSAQQFQEIVATLAARMRTSDGALPRQDVERDLDKVYGQQPLEIRKALLCRSVATFGVYEAFDHTAILAAREQPVIIYTELDNFASAVTEGGAQRVRVHHEVVLYNETDGLAVWQQPKVEIVDECRNKRRDFFVVRLVRLPARLSVGKYLMKVRITDLTSSSIDEATIPVNVVADNTLVQGPVAK